MVNNIEHWYVLFIMCMFLIAQLHHSELCGGRAGGHREQLQLERVPYRHGVQGSGGEQSEERNFFHQRMKGVYRCDKIECHNTYVN